MKKTSIKFFVSALIMSAFLGQIACSKQMPPARIIPPGDDNTQLCKQSYLLCRSECSTVRKKKVRLRCANQCEQDTDSCLLQSRESKKK